MLLYYYHVYYSLCCPLLIEFLKFLPNLQLRCISIKYVNDMPLHYICCIYSVNVKHHILMVFFCRTLSQLPVHALSMVDTGVLCDNIPGLINRQRRLCKMNRDVMISMVQGAKMGVRECQRQFSENRWNCSTSDRDASVFGKVMLRGKYVRYMQTCI